MDRFISDRKRLDVEVAHWKLMLNSDHSQQADTEYKAALYKTFGLADQINILSIRESKHSVVYVPPARIIPATPKRVLDLPGLVDNYYLNLLDWSTTGLAAVALGSKFHMFDPTPAQITTKTTINSEAELDVHFTLVSFMKGGLLVAAGDSGCGLTITDVAKSNFLHNIRVNSPICSAAWNSYVLSTGHTDGSIQYRDVRDKTSMNAPLRYLAGHLSGNAVCGLKWSEDLNYIASGGNDDRLLVWDHRQTLCPLYSFNNHHTAAVKAIAWSPHSPYILASGGGTADHTVRIWDIKDGTCKSVTDAYSQVGAIQWNIHRNELITAHGFTRNEINIWRYPSMKKEKSLTGHTARILHMAQSPDGRRIATAASDETLRIWKIESKKNIRKKQKVSHPTVLGIPVIR